MTNDHPASEELLLWQSGELDSDEAETIQAHVSKCAQCKAVLEKHAETYEEVAWVSGKAAHRRMRVAMAAKTRRRFVLSPSMSAGVAAVLIVAVTLFTFDLTPAARADTLLAKAMRQQSEQQPGKYSILLRSNGRACLVSSSMQLVSLDGPKQNISSCQGMTAQLHRVGWTGDDALSAASFRDWHKSLSHKTDSVHKAADTTEIQTETNDSPIHKATLRLRTSDDHPVAARYEFAAEGDEPASVIEVGEQSGPPPVLMAHSSPAPTPHNEPQPHPAPVAVVNPLDDAESRVLLALHQSRLDSDVLLAVNREPDAIKLWGVVPTDQAKANLVASLENVPKVQIDIASDAEAQKMQQPLPWAAWHGDAPPLATDQLQARFPNDPNGSQQFLTDIDGLTRRLVSETKSRDAMLSLASRMGSSDSASSLRSAAAQLDASTIADLSSLAGKLSPFLSSTPAPSHPSSYQQATQLYTLLHELFFTGRSQDVPDRDGAWAQVRQLLSGRTV